jgi:hypothetical protein
MNMVATRMHLFDPPLHAPALQDLALHQDSRERDSWPHLNIDRVNRLESRRPIERLGIQARKAVKFLDAA